MRKYDKEKDEDYDDEDNEGSIWQGRWRKYQ